MDLRTVLKCDLKEVAKRLLRKQPPEPKRYPNFDFIRLVAALAVVAMHCNNYVAGEAGHNAMWTGCFFAVPVFLGLSGFLVLKSFSETGSWPRFAWKRICRVVPAWIASLVLVGVLFGAAASWQALRVWGTLGVTLGFGGASKNGPLWSLGWEELFYVGLAILYTLGAYRRAWTIWVLVIASTVVAWFILSVGDVTEGHRLAMWALPSSFFIGNLAYLYRSTVLRVWPAATVVGLGAVIAANFLRGGDFGVQFLLQEALVASVLFFGIAGPTLVKKPFPDLSYGIYVYHSPLVLTLYGFVGNTRSGLFGAALAVVVPMAAVSWCLLERPALKAKNARLQWPRRTTRNAEKLAGDAA